MPTVETTRLAEKIQRYLQLRNGSALRRLLSKTNFADVAEVMDSAMSQAELLTCFQLLNTPQAALVLTSLSHDKQMAVVAALPEDQMGEVLRFMPSDDAVDILQELQTEQSQRILEKMPFDTDTRAIHHLLMEAPDTAAGIMSTDFLRTRIEGTAEDALMLVKLAEEKDFIYYCYVVDAGGKLIATVSLKQLILARPDTPLQEIAQFNIKTVQAADDQEHVVNSFRKYYNLLAIPVLDVNQVLRGIITLDDVIDIIDEETSEDFYLSSGISLEEMDEKNLLTGPVVNAFKARLPWLMVTFFGQFLVAWIIAGFKHTVATATIAVSFLPLLSGLSGNMGTQSETIAVRGLAINLIQDHNIWAKVAREVKVSLMTGIFLALSVGILSFIQYQTWQLSILLFSATIVSMMTSALLGFLIPYSFQKYFKQDPAGVGGPMITTLLDIITFSTVLSVITYFMHGMI